MNDAIEVRSWADDEQRLRLLSGLVGVRLDPARLPAIAAYLTEVRQLGDELLGLELEAAQPDAVYDPSWPENEG